MNNQNNKMSVKTPRNGMSDITKEQDIFKCGTATIRGKTNTINNSKIPSGFFLRSEPPAGNYKKPESRSKPIHATPKSSAKVTSEGVHEFIKNVSNFIEEKNPFKESATQQKSREKRKNVDSNSVNLIQFNGVCRKNQEKNQNKNKKPNQVQKIWENNFSKGGSPRRKENLQERSNEGKYENSQKLRNSNSDFACDSHFDSKHFDPTSQNVLRPGTPLQESNYKKKKPSEIPLRKTQKSLERPSTNPLSNAFKEDENFLPNFDDFDLHSDFQMTFNFNFNTDDICSLGSRGSNQILNALVNDNCILSEDAFFIESLLCGKSCERIGKSSLECKEHTPSFTVLSKLESLHKKTLSTKDSKKNSKTLLNTQKETKLNQSSKENKMGLKSKTKKLSNVTEKKSQEKLNKGIKRKAMDSNGPKTEAKKEEFWTPVSPKPEIPKKEENKSLKKQVPSRQKLGLSGSLKEKEFGKLPSKFSRQGFEKPEKPKTARSSSENPRLRHDLKSSNSEERNLRLKSSLHSDKNHHPITPPPTPETVEATVISSIQCEDGDEVEWSAKTLLCDDKFTGKDFPWCKSSDRKTETLLETSESLIPDLVVKGKSLISSKDESLEKSEEPDHPTAKKLLKIDLRTHEDIADSETMEETPEDKSVLDWILMDEGNYMEGIVEEKINLKEGGEGYFGEASFERTENCRSLSDLRCCSSQNHKIVESDIRSSFGNRSFAGSLFDSNINQHCKIKPDTKPRSSLTKSFNRGEVRDTLEDTVLLRLKRRSSEPISFRGFVWKCADRAIPKDHKASVSSMTSSLRHLNTDEIDDFTLWEAIPQKLSCCWEMSLYNCKRTWSVLSNSVFKDNRKSNTPGLILENLRNGITPNSRESRKNQNDCVIRLKENPFDVEPSIAQKNIDIRNWLAALNFPTPPSTSAEVITEGNFSSQSKIESLITPKIGTKRRKTFLTFIYSEDKLEEKRKWNSMEGVILPELVNEKSDGFSTSQITAYQPVPLSHSKSAEDSPLTNLITWPKKYKSLEMAHQPEVFQSSAISAENLQFESSEPQEETKKMAETGNSFGNFLKGDFNIWKYLFLLTLFIILAHYCFLTNYSCRL